MFSKHFTNMYRGALQKEKFVLKRPYGEVILMNPSKSLHQLVPIWSANDPTVGSFWWYKSTFKHTYKTLWVHLNDLFPK